MISWNNELVGMCSITRLFDMPVIMAGLIVPVLNKELKENPDQFLEAVEGGLDAAREYLHKKTEESIKAAWDNQNEEHDRLPELLAKRKCQHIDSIIDEMKEVFREARETGSIDASRLFDITDKLNTEVVDSENKDRDKELTNEVFTNLRKAKDSLYGTAVSVVFTKKEDIRAMGVDIDEMLEKAGELFENGMEKIMGSMSNQPKSSYLDKMDKLTPPKNKRNAGLVVSKMDERENGECFVCYNIFPAYTEITPVVDDDDFKNLLESW